MSCYFCTALKMLFLLCSTHNLNYSVQCTVKFLLLSAVHFFFVILCTLYMSCYVVHWSVNVILIVLYTVNLIYSVQWTVNFLLLSGLHCTFLLFYSVHCKFLLYCAVHGKKLTYIINSLCLIGPTWSTDRFPVVYTGWVP